MNMRQKNDDHVVVMYLVTISKVATNGWNALTQATTTSLLNTVRPLDAAAMTATTAIRMH
jgi:phosphoribosylformimino-5-aminoimidazole carboxamide ribonucleotide (ProFAR) isomerase